MRRILRTAALPVLALAVFGGVGTAGAATAPHPAASAATCTGTIDITQFAFTEASVQPDQLATADLTAVNCTAQPVTVTVESYGRFVAGSGTGIAPGCPAIDPIAPTVTIPAGGQYTNSNGTLVPTGCTATSLQDYVNFYNASGTLAQATATVTINQTAPPVGCHVTYTTSSEWHGGFVASIAITNTGAAPVNGWTLTYAYSGDEKVTDAWNANFSQPSYIVTLTNVPSDATIAPGATLTGVGMLGSWTTSDGPPEGFTLNDTRCDYSVNAGGGGSV